MTTNAFQPELGQLLTAPRIGRFAAPRFVSGEIGFLASAVCARHPEVFADDCGEDWQDYYDSQEQCWAQDHFLRWGGGWFENELFLIHGYTYDDSCDCGVMERERLEGGPPYYQWTPDPKLAALGLDQDDFDTLRPLLCACPDGWSEIEPLTPAIPLPANFVYKGEPACSMDWYKHIYRSATWSRADISQSQLQDLIQQCRVSLRSEPLVMETEIRNWPVRQARRAQYEAQRDRFLAQSPDQQRLIIATHAWV